MPRFTDRSPVHVEPLTSLAALEALRPQWEALWRSDSTATPFQSSAWLIPWWKHLGCGDLCVLSIRAEKPAAFAGKLVGLLPLYIYTQPDSRSRDVFLIGIGTTDHLDGLFAPGWQHCGAAAALEWLNQSRARWDLLDLQPLRADSPLMNIEPPAGWEASIAPAAKSPVLELPRNIAELTACIPPRMLHNLHYYRRRAPRQGQVQIESADESNLDELLKAHLALHGARWQSRGQSGVLAEANVALVHREAAGQLLVDGTLRLYAMRLNGRIVATLYGLCDAGQRAGGRFYYYLGGMDPALEKLSPGTLLLGHAIERAIEEGCLQFDFLRGAEAYKYLWGARDTTLYARRLRHAPASSPPLSVSASEGGLDCFEVHLKVTIRPCRREDLPTLEWFGLFARDNLLIENIFNQHERGEAVMLVADANGVASGQVWIDLSRRRHGIGFIWALRVFPTLQRKGVGARLINAAEEVLRQRGFRIAEITVEKENAGALRLYRRLGYRVIARSDPLVLRKPLRHGNRPDSGTGSQGPPDSGGERHDDDDPISHRGSMDARRRQRARL